MELEENKRLGELIIQLSRGNKAEQDSAIKEIYDKMYKILYSTGNTYYSSKEDLEDSVQNLLLSLFVNAGKYAENTNACGWIMQIYRNTFINFRKRRKRERNYFKNQVQILREAKSDFKEYSEKYFLYNYIISKLSDYELELFFYRYFYDYSINDIATELDKPKSTIQSQLDKLELKIRNF